MPIPAHTFTEAECASNSIGGTSSTSRAHTMSFFVLPRGLNRNSDSSVMRVCCQSKSMYCFANDTRRRFCWGVNRCCLRRLRGFKSSSFNARWTVSFEADTPLLRSHWEILRVDLPRFPSARWMTRLFKAGVSLRGRPPRGRSCSCSPASNRFFQRSTVRLEHCSSSQIAPTDQPS